MAHVTRRNFLQSATLAASTLGIGGCNAMMKSASNSAPNTKIPFQLGMASYSLRNFNLEQTLRMTQTLNLNYITLKSYHLPLDSSKSHINKVRQMIADRGMTLFGGGVIYMKNIAEVNQAFEYAKTAGMRVIKGVPEHHLLDIVQEKVKEYDIEVAIHNHGPGDKRYPTPESAYRRIENMDKRMGLCIDTGHTKRSGLDPSEETRRFADRVLDVDFKDVDIAAAEGKSVEMGRGVIDIPKFVKTLIDINYTGVAAFEYEKDPDAPMVGLAESVGYVRGIIATI